MQHPFSVESPNRGRLNDLVSRVVEVDARMRAMQAELTVLLAEAYQLADDEGESPVKPATSDPEPGDMASADTVPVGTVPADTVLVGAEPGLVTDEAVVRANIAAREAGAGASVAAGVEASIHAAGAAAGAAADGAAFGLLRVERPRGALVWRDRSYRVVRAEIAAALRVPEGRVGTDMAHAATAVERCPAMLGALAKGQVTDQHVRGVVNAGRIIGHQVATQLAACEAAQAVGEAAAQALEQTNNPNPTADATDASAGTGAAAADGSADVSVADATAGESGVGAGVWDEAAVARETARRYALLDRAAVVHAKQVTASKLAPTAKRIAEKLAGVTFDERHALAKRDRRVRLVELDDGMCRVEAVLTSFEAQIVFDRVTQYATLLQDRDVAAGRAAAEAAGERLTAGAVAALKRPLGEARADSLTVLLAHGDVTDEDLYRTCITLADTDATAGTAGTADTDCTAGTTGAAEITGTAGIAGEAGTAGASGGVALKRLGLRVDARVQVLVPVSLTGLLDHPSNQGASVAGVAAGRSAGAAVSRAVGLGRGFQPELVGVGPIDTDTAVRLLHDTPSWDMITVTDGTGSTISETSGAAGTGAVSTGTSTDETSTTITGANSTDGTGETSTDSTGTTENVAGTIRCRNCGTVNSSNTSTGDILTVESYRVPAHLKRYLAARDPSCRFPGCTLPIYRCDIDHTIAASEGGPTSLNNTAGLCRGHHVMKHHGGCVPEQESNGDFRWKFPSGREYRTEPPSRVTFRTMLEPPEVQASSTQQPISKKQVLNDGHSCEHPFGIDEWDSPPEASAVPGDKQMPF